MKATDIKIVAVHDNSSVRDITAWSAATPENIAKAKKACKGWNKPDVLAGGVEYKIRYSRPVSDLQRAALEKGIQSRILRGCVGQLKGLYYRHYGKESEELRQLQIMLEISINEQYSQAKEKLQCKKNT